MLFTQFVATVQTEGLVHAVMYAECLGVSEVNINEWKRKVASIAA